jgi:hypothetical protein
MENPDDPNRPINPHFQQYITSHDRGWKCGICLSIIADDPKNNANVRAHFNSNTCKGKRRKTGANLEGWRVQQVEEEHTYIYYNMLT